MKNNKEDIYNYLYDWDIKMKSQEEIGGNKKMVGNDLSCITQTKKVNFLEDSQRNMVIKYNILDILYPDGIMSHTEYLVDRMGYDRVVRMKVPPINTLAISIICNHLRKNF